MFGMYVVDEVESTLVVMHGGIKVPADNYIWRSYCVSGCCLVDQSAGAWWGNRSLVIVKCAIEYFVDRLGGIRAEGFKHIECHFSLDGEITPYLQ